MNANLNAAPDLIRGLTHRQQTPDPVWGCAILTGQA